MKKILLMIFLFGTLGVFAQSGGSNRPSTPINAYDGIVTGWTILPGTPDTLYNNDSSLVKLNNWLMTDYITNCAVDDPFDGALGITNSKQTNVILGYLAGVNHPAMPRVGYSIVFSVFTGLAAGISADTISYSVFDGYGAGMSSSNVSYSVFDGYKAGYHADSVFQSVFLGEWSGGTSNNISDVLFLGDSVGYGADGVHNQVWIDDSPTSTPLIRGYFAADSLVINGDLTATGNIQITGDGSPKFQFQVILDTLCSVRVGIDTVRLHPPR